MTRFKDLDIEHIGRGLEAKTLPKSEWTHAAHFAAAFWLLRRPDCDATVQMPELIRAYNEATGNPNTDVSGYHETITLASIRAASAWLRLRSDAPLAETLDEFLAGPQGHPDWMLSYWSRARLFSPKARQIWVSPDLKSLPF